MSPPSRRTASATESVEVDAYVLDTLMHDLIGHDRSASAFVVYLHLWRHSLGVGEPTIQTSLRDIAEGTGLSKRGVQEALSILARRQLVGITRQTITDIPVYTVRRPLAACDSELAQCSANMSKVHPRHTFDRVAS